MEEGFLTPEKNYKISEQQSLVLAKVTNAISEEKDLQKYSCICGVGENDEVVTNDFYLNLSDKIKVVICKNCGLIRLNPYFTKEFLANYYQFYYRDLYQSFCPNIDYNDGVFEGNQVFRFLDKHINKYKSNYNKKQIKVFEIGCGFIRIF